MTGSRYLVAVLTVCTNVLAGCTQPPDVIWPLGAKVELLGFEAIVGDDGNLSYVFDRQSKISVRGPSPAPHSPFFFLNGDEKTELGVERRLQRGDFVFLQFVNPGVEAGRQGRLVLGQHSWPARFAYGADEWPSLQHAQAQKKRGNFEAAVRSIDEAALTNPLEELQGFVLRAGALRQAGDSTGYLRALKAWENRARQLEIRTAESQAIRAQAFTAFYGRDFDAALRHLERSEAIDQAIGNASGLVRSNAYRSLVFRELGRYRDSMRVAKVGQTLAEAYDLSADAALQAKVVASLWFTQGQYAKALKQLDEIAERFLSGDLQVYARGFLVDRGWALALGMLAGVVDEDWKRPHDDFTRALELVRKTGDRGAEANILTNLVWVADLAGDSVAYETRLAELESLDLSDHAYSRTFATTLRGKVALRDGDLKTAERLFKSSLAMARREAPDDASDASWRALYGLAQTAKMQGSLRLSAERFTEALSEVDGLARRTELRSARALFVQDRASLVDDAIRLHLDRKQPSAALAVAEQARMHVFRPLVAQSALEALSPEQRGRWRARLTTYERLRGDFEKRHRAEELVAAADLPEFRTTTAKMRAQLETQFDEAYSVLDARLGEATMQQLNIAELEARLGQEKALLYFHRAANGFEVFFVGHRGVQHQFQTSPSSGPWVARAAKYKHLFVVAPTAVDTWAVFPTPESVTQLFRTTSVSFLPFARLVQRDAPAIRGGMSVVVADPGSNLPFAREEAKVALGKLENTRSLIGQQATRDTVRAALQDASYFHFSGHGHLSSSDPWDARLALAEGQSVNLGDFLIGGPRLKRVVLSGCETGRTKALSRNIHIGLPDAFLLGGAETVVATTEVVEDAVAVRFMALFYEEGGAVDAVQAFRRTALALSRANDDTWTAFYVAGRPIEEKELSPGKDSQPPQ